MLASPRGLLRGAAPLYAVVFGLALANRLLPVLRGGGLAGVLGYDDAVYYAGAVGLVHGRLPYRDFLLLHPPGVLVALTPVAAWGRWVGETAGWEASRLVWMLLGCATSLVVVAVLLPLGRTAAAVGGGFYAVFPGAVLVERTTLVEGLTNLCLAVSLALLIRALRSVPVPAASADVAQRVSRTTLAAVGVVLGLSTAVKIWGVVPLVTVTVFVGIVLGVRQALVIMLGAAAASTVICLPFFLAAPTQMWRMVVLDQLGRDQGTDLLRRAAEIATMDRLTGGGAFVAIAVVVAGAVICSVVSWRVRPFRIIVPVLAATVSLLVAAPIFYPHYLGIVAVPAALLVGVTAGVLAGVLAGGSPHVAWRSALAVAALVAVTLDVVALSRISSGALVPAALTVPVQTAPGCLTSDDPNNLLALGVVGRNVERGCALVVDLGGHSHDLSRGQVIPRSRNAAWQRLVVDYLGSGHYTLATRLGPGRGYSKATVSTIDSWPVRVQAGGHRLREPSR
jgi:hypothetical protein